jgi:hypothetical protein
MITDRLQALGAFGVELGEEALRLMNRYCW